MLCTRVGEWTNLRCSGGESVMEDVIECDRGRGTRVSSIVGGAERGGGGTASKPASASQLGLSLTYCEVPGGDPGLFFEIFRGRMGTI